MWWRLRWRRRLIKSRFEGLVTPGIHWRRPGQAVPCLLPTSKVLNMQPAAGHHPHSRARSSQQYAASRYWTRCPVSNAAPAVGEQRPGLASGCKKNCQRNGGPVGLYPEQAMLALLEIGSAAVLLPPSGSRHLVTLAEGCPPKLHLQVESDAAILSRLTYMAQDASWPQHGHPQCPAACVPHNSSKGDAMHSHCRCCFAARHH